MSASAVFSRPVMADAADRGHEQHARRHDGGENLGVMAGAAGHADAICRRQRLRWQLRSPAGMRASIMAGAPVRRRSTRDAAAALRGDLGGHARSRSSSRVDDGWVVVANLEQHFRTSRDDARRTGIERDAAGGPYRAWSACVRGSDRRWRRKTWPAPGRHPCEQPCGSCRRDFARR